MVLLRGVNVQGVLWVGSPTFFYCGVGSGWGANWYSQGQEFHGSLISRIKLYIRSNLDLGSKMMSLLFFFFKQEGNCSFPEWGEVHPFFQGRENELISFLKNEKTTLLLSSFKESSLLFLKREKIRTSSLQFLEWEAHAVLLFQEE